MYAVYQQKGIARAKKKPIIMSFILWGVAVLLVITGDFVRLIIAMSLVGLLQVMISSATSALSADLVPKEHRGKTNGARGFFSMIFSSMGMMVGGWLYDNISHSVTWYL
jgi:MFS family permease